MSQGLKTARAEELKHGELPHLAPEGAIAGKPKGGIVVTEVDTGLGPGPGGQGAIINGEALTDGLMRADDHSRVDTEPEHEDRAVAVSHGGQDPRQRDRLAQQVQVAYDGPRARDFRRQSELAIPSDSGSRSPGTQ